MLLRWPIILLLLVGYVLTFPIRSLWGLIKPVQGDARFADPSRGRQPPDRPIDPWSPLLGARLVPVSALASAIAACVDEIPNAQAGQADQEKRQYHGTQHERERTPLT